MTATLADAARNVSETFKSLDVRLHPQSRLCQMVDVLKDGSKINQDQDDRNRFSTAREGIRDILILDFVIERLSTTIDPAALRKKLRLSVKDHVQPQDDRTESPGRDVQTELYVAAVASKGKLNPKFEEPDLLCELAEQPLGVAVKRVKNKKRFEEHFRKAVSQIAKSGVRGIVIMDMSLAFNPPNEPLRTAASIEQMQLSHKKEMKLFVDPSHGKMKTWIHGREVRGPIIIDNILWDQPEYGWSLNTLHYDVPFDIHNQRRRREFEQFRKAFKRGYATPPITNDGN
jgi:hypothetical protein